MSRFAPPSTLPLSQSPRSACLISHWRRRAELELPLRGKNSFGDIVRFSTLPLERSPTMSSWRASLRIRCTPTCMEWKTVKESGARCLTISMGAARWRPGCAQCWRSVTSITSASRVAVKRLPIVVVTPIRPQQNRSTRSKSAICVLAAALENALSALAARDRMRLAYYYRLGLKLREIGRIMNESESGVSRHLEHTRRALRREIERTLIEKHQLNAEQIKHCFGYAAEALPLDLARLLPEGG